MKTIAYILNFVIDTTMLLYFRYAAEDYEGKMLEEAEALRHKMPSFLSPYTYGGGWSQVCN